MTRPARVVLRLPNGVGICVPLTWTDIYPPAAPDAARSRFTVESLLELTDLAESLGSDRTGKPGSGKGAGGIGSQRGHNDETSGSVGRRGGNGEGSAVAAAYGGEPQGDCGATGAAGGRGGGERNPPDEKRKEEGWSQKCKRYT